MAENLSGEATQTNPPVAPELEITQGDNVGEVYKVKLDTRIGRERDNDIVLTDPRISRYHTKISLEDGQWVLADLGSSNYTYLNGTPIDEPTALRPGDMISLGTTELRLRIPGGAPVDNDDISPSETASSPKIIVPPPVAAAEARKVTPAPAPPPGPRAVPRLAWVAGGVILLLCLVAVLVVYFAVGRLTEDETAAVLDASTAVVKDGNVSDQATDGGQVPADLTLAYEDDFSDSFGGWDDAFDTYTRKVYGNNRYQIEVSTSNLVAWGLANRDVADFEVEVEARLEQGAEDNTYGILFRFQDRENFYRFDISGDGFFLLSKFYNGEWQTLVDWTEASQINTGAGVNNILKVAAFGPNITVWANGQQLATVTDDSLAHGNFGFFAGTFSEPYVWVSYDNLKLWLPPGQEQAIVLIPTATRPSTGPTPTPQPSPTPVLPTNTPEAQPTPEQTETAESSESTPTTTPSPTVTLSREPTATPVPLPEYASRDQTLARGETREEGRIIFPVFDSEREVYDIYIADAADGGNRELVQEQASQPVLSADGTNLAYRSWQPDNRGLFARHLSGGDVWAFNPFFESARPSFSPADDSLMFHSRVGGEEPAIYRVVDGVGEVMRREGFPIQGEAAKWSPDGTQFVYSSCLGGKCGIIRSNVDGGVNPVLLSDHPSDTNPEISPDGATVIFMSNRGGNWEIYSVGINGGNITNLTSDPASDGLPTWSPDGSKIAFVSNRDGEWSVWSMNSDGSNQRRLFALGGTIDAIVPHDRANSRGWLEENIDWAP